MADPLGVSIAFDAPWNGSAPTWTRIDTLSGCRVRGWQIDRGRPDEFSKTDVGTATVRVVDRAGLFDPTNATSPYNGKILPGKQAAIALQNPTNDLWHTLFRGFVESWRYALDQTRQYMELELQLVDGFAILSRYELRVGVDGALPPFTEFTDPGIRAKLNELAKGNVLFGETEGFASDRINAILGDVGYPPDLYVTDEDIFSSNIRVGPKSYPPGTSALAALQDVADAEFPGVANLYMSADGHVRFRGRQPRFRPDVVEYGVTRWDVGDDSVTGGDPTIVPMSELEWTLGQDNLVNACSATPQGIGFGTDWRQLNPGPPDNDDVAGQYVTDTVSIAAYGLRSLTFDNLQTIEGLTTSNNSMVETKLFATYYVENYSTPYPRISRLVLKTRRPGAANSGKLWEIMCNVEISDLLTVMSDHPGAGGFDHEFYVEGIHYSARPGPPEHPIIELSLDVSPRQHWDTNPFDADPDPA